VLSFSVLNKLNMDKNTVGQLKDEKKAHDRVVL